MAHRILDRVQQASTSTGTGSLALTGTVSKMRSFSAAGLANGDTFWGLIEHETAAEWELALCTYSSAAGGSITRATPLSSSTGSAVNFSAGNKYISLVSPASKTPYADNNGTFVFTGKAAVLGVVEAVGAPPISGGALSLDLSTYAAFSIANNANAVVTFANPTAGYANSFSMLLTADGTLRAWTWPASVVWLTGAAPTLTSTNGKRDLLAFYTFDGGTTWFGNAVSQNF